MCIYIEYSVGIFSGIFPGFSGNFPAGIFPWNAKLKKGQMSKFKFQCVQRSMRPGQSPIHFTGQFNATLQKGNQQITHYATMRHIDALQVSEAVH